MILGSLALSMASCSDALIDDQNYNYSDSEGGVSIAIETKVETKAGSNLSGSSLEQLENSVLKIYDSSDALIRNYEPATDSPSTIYLVSGEYSLTLDFGSGVEMTTDSQDLTYYGESDFTITSGLTTAVGVTCNVINTVVGVEFDETTLDEYLEAGYKVTLTTESIADESLNFTEDGDGYFILPDDSKRIAWQFEGVRKSDSSAILVNGVISEANAGEKNILTFRYDYVGQYLDFVGGVTVDTSVDEFNDNFDFTYEEDDTTTDPNPTPDPEPDPEPDPDVPSEEITGTIDSVVTDLWNNTATFTTTLSSNEYTTATMQVRESEETVWQTVDLTASGDSYVATAGATWSAQTNAAGLTYYTPSNGIWAGTSYECQLVVDGVVLASKTFNSNPNPAANDTSNGVQTIPDGDLNDTSLACYTTSHGSSSWDSGNCKPLFSAYYLCDDDSKTFSGVTCAKLETTNIVGVLAAGNIFYGDFAYASFTGTVSFGRPFTWTARPRSLKLKYAASLEEGSITAPDGAVDGGTTFTQDRGRIFLAIVDWSSQQKVASGTSDPTGCWDPTLQTTIEGTGDIIGYASMFIDESTDLTKLHDLELPIYYYDTVTNPSSSNYSLVISCAASAYGDYKIGVEDSVLYVDDFEFGY